MIFKLACGDVMPGCTATFENSSKDALMAAVGAHAGRDHGITDFTPDIVEAVESRIVQLA